MMAGKAPVVLLPGQLCTELLWQPQMDALKDVSDPRMIVLDRHDTVAGMAQDVLDRSPERFALAAHAMGGFVAFEILRRAPERVTRLALLSTLAPADTPKQTVRREGYLRLVEQGKFDEIIEERIPMLVHPDRVADDALCGMLRKMASDTGAERFQRQQRAIMSRPDSTPSLSAIRCPTLIVYGRADGITTLAHQEEMLAGIPGARLEIVEDSGHMLTLERPAKVNALLRDFLAAG